MAEKIRIQEPYSISIGGDSGYIPNDKVDFIKIHFFESLTQDRAVEIAKEIEEHITRD